MKSNLIDITLIKIRETDKAYGVKETEEDDELIWLPKSEVEIEPTKKTGIFIVTMPEWLAHEKELI